MEKIPTTPNLGHEEFALAQDALAGGHHLLRRGKKRYHLLRMQR